MMVKVWLYAFARGIRSSRKVEQALHEDVAFRMLSGNQQPDHWTLSEFWRRHLEALGDLFVQTVKLGQVAIDGTKIKANASKHAAMSYGRMGKGEERLSLEIEAYFHEAEAADQEEDGRHGTGRPEELPKYLQTAQKTLQAIREAKRALEEEARRSAQQEQDERKREAEAQGKTYRTRKDPREARPKDRDQWNFTDPDSRIMKSSDKAFIQGYNAQAAVATGSQIIVAAEVTNQAGGCRAHGPPGARGGEGDWETARRGTGRRGLLEREERSVLGSAGDPLSDPPDKVRHSTWRQQKPVPPPPSGGIIAGEDVLHAQATTEQEAVQDAGADCETDVRTAQGRARAAAVPIGGHGESEPPLAIGLLCSEPAQAVPALGTVLPTAKRIGGEAR